VSERRPPGPRSRFPARVGDRRDKLLASGSPAGLLRPQRPLSVAAADLARASTPSGLGLDSAAVRQRMVERLCRDGVSHPAVLAALGQVPRHEFVDTALVAQAYEDTSLPIGWGQTISKPSVVGRMLELLCAGDNASRAGHLGRTLEVGTGCGYQAAVLVRLARSVVSIERLQPLHESARLRLEPHRGDALRLVWGDGMGGHPPNAPYDSIIAAAAGSEMPTAWLEQLAVGGRLVAPVHDAAAAGHVLVVVDRLATGFRQQRFEAVNFVPLKSGAE
jgi:protein-L-isoaspartate(D-aspartate) O-methyltransferase